MSDQSAEPRRQTRSDWLYGVMIGRIVEDAWPAGERLPTEHALAAEFGVSRSVVREALMRLRADGIVAGRQGSGSFVQRRPPDRLLALAPPADLASILRGFELRLPLEGTAARLAAERRSAEDLAALSAVQEQLGRELSAGAMRPATDLAFHRAIAVATGNEVFVTVLDAIGSAVRVQMDVALTLTRERGQARAAAVFAEHARILDAIRSGDGEGAEIAMRYHIDQARKRLTDRTREG